MSVEKVKVFDSMPDDEQGQHEYGATMMLTNMASAIANVSGAKFAVNGLLSAIVNFTLKLEEEEEDKELRKRIRADVCDFLRRTAAQLETIDKTMHAGGMKN